MTANDKTNTPAQTALVNKKFANSDLGATALGPGQCYPNDASIGTDAIAGAAKVRRETFDSSTPSGRIAARRVALLVLQGPLRQQLSTNSSARVQLIW